MSEETACGSRVLRICSLQRASRWLGLGFRSCTVAVAITRPGTERSSGAEARSITVAREETSTAEPVVTLRDAVGPWGPQARLTARPDRAVRTGGALRATRAVRAVESLAAARARRARRTGRPRAVGPLQRQLRALVGLLREAQRTLRGRQRSGGGAARRGAAHRGADRAGQQHDERDANEECEEPAASASGDPCQESSERVAAPPA